MADLFTSKAVTFIEQNRSTPFFLYFATHDLHVPRVPNPRFAGSSGMGPRGDAIVEGDWSVGRILEALDRLKLAERTLVIFTSDNGPVVDDGYKDQAVEKLGAHKVAGPLRGGKGSNFEGGTRVPFLVRWTGQIKPGVSSALVSQIDLLASFASFTGYTLADADAPDSFDVMAALLGKATTGRQSLVQQSTVLSFRDGNWKYIEPSQGPAVTANTNIETGNDPKGLLYDLNSDPGERQNLAAKYPERMREMAARLAEIKSQGRAGSRDTDNRRRRRSSRFSPRRHGAHGDARREQARSTASQLGAPRVARWDSERSAITSIM
jgi:arylsulfatase A-like enzyme